MLNWSLIAELLNEPDWSDRGGNNFAAEHPSIDHPEHRCRERPQPDTAIRGKSPGQSCDFHLKSMRNLRYHGRITQWIANPYTSTAPLSLQRKSLGCADQSDGRDDNSNKPRVGVSKFIGHNEKRPIGAPGRNGKGVSGIDSCFPRPVFSAGFCQLCNTGGSTSDSCAHIYLDHFSIGFALRDFAFHLVSNKPHSWRRVAGVFCCGSVGHRPLEHRLAFVAFSLLCLVVFVCASRQYPRNRINPVGLTEEKDVPRASDIIRVEHVPVAKPLSRQGDSDRSAPKKVHAEM